MAEGAGDSWCSASPSPVVTCRATVVAIDHGAALASLALAVAAPSRIYSRSGFVS